MFVGCYCCFSEVCPWWLLGKPDEILGITQCVYIHGDTCVYCVCTSQKLWHGSYIMTAVRLITSGGAQWLIVGSSLLAGVLTLGHRASVLPHTHIVKVLLRCTPITLRPSYTSSPPHPFPISDLSLCSSFTFTALHPLHSSDLCFFLTPAHLTLPSPAARPIYLVLTSLHSTLPCLPVSFSNLFVQPRASESPKLYCFDLIAFKLCHFPHSCTL